MNFLTFREKMLAYRRSRCGANVTVCVEAFSLVEVVLALGIVSFGLLTLLGLMSVGMMTLHQAIQQTIETQIVQSIKSQALLTSYTSLTNNFSGAVFYYDDEGQFLTNSTTLAPNPAPANTHYCVTTTLGNSAYPGSTNFSSAVLGTNILAIQIQIAVGANISTAHTPTTNTIQVPNMGG